MSITYETTAQKYLGAVQGDYNENLPPPTSRLTTIISWYLYPGRYTVKEQTDTSITVFDSETSQIFTIALDTVLMQLWGKIIANGSQSANFSGTVTLNAVGSNGISGNLVKESED